MLPIVRRGTRRACVDASIYGSEIWKNTHMYRLEQNMRVLTKVKEGLDATQLQRFADWLLRIGDGVDGEVVHIPEEFLAPTQCYKDLVETIYGGLLDPYSDKQQENQRIQKLMQRCILAPRNKDVKTINSHVIQRLAGDASQFLSADDPGIEPLKIPCPPELLHSLDPQGLPPHELQLKVGMPIILLRNLCPAAGLANGTRLIVTQLGKYSIQGRITSGTHINEIVDLPRIDLTSKEGEYTFTLRRRQYPIKPAFALTINKAQGQTLQRVGVYLPTPVFAHGQLDTAITRVGDPAGLTIMLAHKHLDRAPSDEDPAHLTHTYNIVYKEALPPSEVRNTHVTYILSTYRPRTYVAMTTINDHHVTMTRNHHHQTCTCLAIATTTCTCYLHHIINILRYTS